MVGSCAIPGFALIALVLCMAVSWRRRFAFRVCALCDSFMTNRRRQAEERQVDLNLAGIQVREYDHHAEDQQQQDYQSGFF